MRPSEPSGATPRQRHPHRRLPAGIAAAVAVALVGVVVAGYIVDNGKGTIAPGPGGNEVGGRQPVGSAEGPVVQLASWSGGGLVNVARPGKPTVLFAMAGWCSTCLPPARNLEALHEEFGDRVQVIAVSVDPGETEETLGRFRKAAGDPGYLWGFDRDGNVARTFELRYLDTVVVLDATGELLHKSVRPSNDELRQILANALAKPR